MIINLNAENSVVSVTDEAVEFDNNILDYLGATLKSCKVSGVFKKEDLNTASAKGTVKIEYEAPCSRCGEAVQGQMEIPFDVCYSATPSDDCYLLSGRVIDATQMITDTILLSFPPVILCKEDCLGRCEKCGKNLNEGPCRCSEELDLDDPANPFYELKKLMIGGKNHGSSKG